MLTILVYILILIIFDIAALYWGFNSSDGPESSEWRRRQQNAWPQEDSQTGSMVPLTSAYCSHYC